MTVCLALHQLKSRLIWVAVFDNGCLRQDPEKAKQMVGSLLSTMRNEESPLPKNSLIEVHDSVWHRIVKVCTFISFELPDEY